MPKYKCVSSLTSCVPLDATIIAKPIGADRILLIQDSDFKTDSESIPMFTRGEELPLKGCLWEWELVPKVAIIGPTHRIGSHLKS